LPLQVSGVEVQRLALVVGTAYFGLKTQAHIVVRSCQINEHPLCRGGPLCPPGRTRRVTSGAQDVVLSCTYK